jgi:hypothetical protein
LFIVKKLGKLCGGERQRDLRPISTQKYFPQKENFVKRDFPSENNYEVENFRKIFCPWKFFLNGNGPLVSIVRFREGP